MEYSFNKAFLNTDRLLVEVTSGMGIAPSYINTANGQVIIAFIVELTSDQQTTLTSLVTSHVAMTSQEQVQVMIRNAEAFGDQLIEQFKIENILMGITVADKAKAVSDYCHKLNHYLSTGSLYAAMDEIDALQLTVALSGLSPFVTSARLSSYKTQIQSYLGI